MNKKCIIALIAGAIMILTPLISVCDSDATVRYDTDTLQIEETGADYDVPSSYRLDPELITPVKDQGNFGTCTYFSTIAAMESLMIINDLENRSDVNLSELFLGGSWLTGFGYDRITANEDETRNLYGTEKLGGSYNFIAASMLLNWVGPIDEELAPYSDADVDYTSDLSLSEFDRFHLKSYKSINVKDTDTIKYLLTQNHPAIISTNADTIDITADKYTTFYNPDAVTTNHSLMLIGYDDNYSADNFGNEPPGNGAWLVKNSWGSNKYTNGYAWISYYNIINEPIFFMEIFEEDSCDKQYAYDYGLSPYNNVTYDNIGMMANVFTSERNETLKTVSFMSFKTSDADYSIQIYKNLQDLENPKSGFLASSANGHFSNAGVVAVDLDKCVKLAKGDTFSVVVTVSGNEKIYLSIDGDAILECMGLDEFFCDPVASAGQSFVSGNGETWTDISADGSGNARIRAYTDGASENSNPRLAVVVTMAAVGILVVVIGRR